MNLTKIDDEIKHYKYHRRSKDVIYFYDSSIRLVYYYVFVYYIFNENLIVIMVKSIWM